MPAARIDGLHSFTNKVLSLLMTIPADALSEALGHAPSDKRLEVLRRVAETGSISQAARDAGISYKAAWQAIDTLSNLSGQTLVERTVGGSGGGGARITPQGLQLLSLADELARSRRRCWRVLPAGRRFPSVWVCARACATSCLAASKRWSRWGRTIRRCWCGCARRGRRC